MNYDDFLDMKVDQEFSISNDMYECVACEALHHVHELEMIEDLKESKFQSFTKSIDCELFQYVCNDCLEMVSTWN